MKMDLSIISMNIVNQLFDLADVPVEKRQQINDDADNFVKKMLMGVVKEEPVGTDDWLSKFEEFLCDPNNKETIENLKNEIDLMGGETEIDNSELNEIEETLHQINQLADHCIPYYAYGDNEAACRMSEILNQIYHISKK